jgi:archaemetzincin
MLLVNDLKDACMSILPRDGYKTVFLLSYNMYNLSVIHPDGWIVKGTAFIDGRIAFISKARANPFTDELRTHDRTHEWPASHCIQFSTDYFNWSRGPASVRAILGDSMSSAKITRDQTPLRAAVQAGTMCRPITNVSRASKLSALWRGRVCEATTHEVEHSLGIDHCISYDCNMGEHGGQSAPYYYPIDLAKLLRATGGDEVERYEALIQYCKKKPAYVHSIRIGPLWNTSWTYMLFTV